MAALAVAAPARSPVVGAVQRKGNVVARVIEIVDSRDAWQDFVREAVSNKVSLIATDDHGGYREAGQRISARHRAAHR